MLQFNFNKKKLFKKTLFVFLCFLIILNIFVIIENIQNKFQETEMSKDFENNPDLNKCLKILFDFNGFLFDGKFFDVPGNIFVAGVFQDTAIDLNDKLKIEYEEICNLHFTFNKNLNNILITGFFLNCSTFSVQISIFYKRNEFYWIGYGDKEFKYFGDVNRALNL